MLEHEPTIDDIRDAAERIKKYIHRTPVLTCRTFNHLYKTELFFKCENLQKVGAFKIRGATNTVFSLSNAELERGVATHSSGNHAAALALAAKMRNSPAFVVMPENAPPVKIAAVKGYGAEVIFCEPTLQAREEGLNRVVEKTGATFVHPYNNYSVIAGAATASLELYDEVADLDFVMTPVGGGGLLAGTALTVKALNPKVEVIAGEPKNADDAFQSLQAGKIIPVHQPVTIADGLKTSLGNKTFPIIYRLVHDILTVDEESIILAMRMIWERMKIIVEPSSAVPFAAVITNPGNFENKRVGIILSGGNVNLDNLPWMNKKK